MPIVYAGGRGKQKTVPELAYADIKVGDSASLAKTVTEADVVVYAGLIGDFNPIHIDA